MKFATVKVRVEMAKLDECLCRVEPAHQFPTMCLRCSTWFKRKRIGTNVSAARETA